MSDKRQVFCKFPLQTENTEIQLFFKEYTETIFSYFLSVKSEPTKAKFDKSRERSTTVPANSSAKIKGIYSDEDSTEDQEDNTGLEDG